MALEVAHELSADDVERLLAAYRDTWFGTGRERADLERMLAGTDAMVALYEDGTLVAFGHALTDGAYVALVRDVVVTEGARGEGVGRRLLEELFTHPALEDVDRFTVVCPERLGDFYEACGFTERTDAAVYNRDAE